MSKALRTNHPERLDDMSIIWQVGVAADPRLP